MRVIGSAGGLIFGGTALCRVKIRVTLFFVKILDEFFSYQIYLKVKHISFTFKHQMKSIEQFVKIWFLRTPARTQRVKIRSYFFNMSQNKIRKITPMNPRHQNLSEGMILLIVVCLDGGPLGISKLSFFSSIFQRKMKNPL